jgi:hypothetical protein
MFDILPTPLPWYLTGSLMGLIVAGIIAGITLRDVVSLGRCRRSLHRCQKSHAHDVATGLKECVQT